MLFYKVLTSGLEFRPNRQTSGHRNRNPKNGRILRPPEPELRSIPTPRPPIFSSPNFWPTSIRPFAMKPDVHLPNIIP